MKIGELSAKAQVSIDTIRYYEKQGLIQPVSRLNSGYRQYDSNSLRQLHFIIKAKHLGFSLVEISELLSLRIDRENQPCSAVKELAESKVLQIEKKIQQLDRMHCVLKRISDSCCGGDEPAAHCSILDALENNSEV